MEFILDPWERLLSGQIAHGVAAELAAHKAFIFLG